MDISSTPGPASTAGTLSHQASNSGATSTQTTPLVDAFLATSPVDIYDMLALIVVTSATSKADAKKNRQLAQEAAKQDGIAAANKAYEAAEHTYTGAMVNAGMEIAGGVVQCGGGVFGIKAGIALKPTPLTKTEKTTALAEAKVTKGSDLTEKEVKDALKDALAAKNKKTQEDQVHSGGQPVNARYEKFSGLKIIAQANSQMLNAFGDIGKASEDLKAAMCTKEKDLLIVAQTQAQNMYDDQNDTMKNQQELTSSALSTLRDITASLHETNRALATA